MAQGVIHPFSLIPITSGKVFPSVHFGQSSNYFGGDPTPQYDSGMGVMASVDADCVWELRFAFPPAIPAGTCRLRLIALANATAGSAKVNPKWVTVGMEEDPSSKPLIAEGTQTLTWSAGDNDQYKEIKIDLDADTPAANTICAMKLVFETSGWTLAQVSTWQAMIIWE